MTKPAPLSREERSWVLYDAANSAFVLVMITAIDKVTVKLKDGVTQGLFEPGEASQEVSHQYVIMPMRI